jgi:hypothetical protein
MQWRVVDLRETQEEVHVIPTDHAHEETVECWCDPELESYAPDHDKVNVVVTHKSLQ